MKQQPIYVEIPIYAPLEEVWHATQDPVKHQEWDLRFSSITYLPKSEGEPQSFLYQTNIGLGLTIAGWGESIGSHDLKDGSKTSSLRFGTDQMRSLIREGRGYWKYHQQEEQTLFLTQYDYDVRYGAVGRFIDRIGFRPMIGWATALSFDVLKRVLERGEAPSSQFLRFFSTWLMVFFFCFIWLYHGLVPKLIAVHPEEVMMMQRALGSSSEVAIIAVNILGIFELFIAVIWLLYRNKRQLFLLQIIGFPILTITSAFIMPELASAPFNPITFNLALTVLSVIGFYHSKDIPSAKSCKRQRG
ncbi:DoxX-like family protein [Alkalicoccobacillus porphyridii]|uniref:DoxX-like family protein n=1 Tax=Alkalicoccobacillus porphyridii TaxID=2597270 RepID=A0A554A1V5_9BACI|nr:DoxX-like family protein [Alkalicoccobacillus porphyridii]TSB47674.1 hypothetical protein FN960_03925 [Alkalicoccobacillus porphyridii]